jgi:hypothetical protein
MSGYSFQETRQWFSHQWPLYSRERAPETDAANLEFLKNNDYILVQRGVPRERQLAATKVNSLEKYIDASPDLFTRWMTFGPEHGGYIDIYKVKAP